MKDIHVYELCASVIGKMPLNFTLKGIEPNQPITLALTNDVMNFISSITRERIKSKCSFGQCKLHCFQAWICFLNESIWCRGNEVGLHLLSVKSPGVSILPWLEAGEGNNF